MPKKLQTITAFLCYMFVLSLPVIAGEDGKPFSVDKGNKYARIDASLEAEPDFFEARMDGKVMESSLSFFHAEVRNTEGEQIARIGAMGQYYTLGENEMAGNVNQNRSQKLRSALKSQSGNNDSSKNSSKQSDQDISGIGGFGILGFGCYGQFSVGPVPIVLKGKGTGIFMAGVSFPQFSTVSGNLMLSLRGKLAGGPGVRSSTGCYPFFSFGPSLGINVTNRDRIYGILTGVSSSNDEQENSGGGFGGEASVTLSGRLTFFEGKAKFSPSKGTLQLDGLNLEISAKATVYFRAPSFGPFGDEIKIGTAYKRKLLQTDSLWSNRHVFYDYDQKNEKDQSRKKPHLTVWDENVYRETLRELIQHGHFGRTEHEGIQSSPFKQKDEDAESTKIDREMVKALSHYESRAQNAKNASYRPSREQNRDTKNFQTRLLDLMHNVIRLRELKGSWFGKTLEEDGPKAIKQLFQEDSNSTMRAKYPLVDDTGKAVKENGNILPIADRNHVQWRFSDGSSSSDQQRKKTKNNQHTFTVGNGQDRTVLFAETARSLLKSDQAKDRILGFLLLSRSLHHVMDLASPLHGFSGSESFLDTEKRSGSVATRMNWDEFPDTLARTFGLSRHSRKHLINRHRIYENWVSGQLEDNDPHRFLVQSRFGSEYASKVSIQNQQELRETLADYISQLSDYAQPDLSKNREAWIKTTQKRFSYMGKYAGALMNYVASPYFSFEKDRETSSGNLE